jgi:hypothetical protein
MGFGRKDSFFWLGCLVVFALLFDLFANFGDWSEFFWFCPVTSAILAFALFRRSALLLTTCLVVAAPAQSMWVLDFILQAFGHGMGRTAFLFAAGPLIFGASVLTHVLLIPVSFWGVWRLGFHPRALLPSLVYAAGILSASFFFTPPENNVNCVFYPCDMLDPGTGYGLYFVWRSLFQWLIVAVISYFTLWIVFHNRIVSVVKDTDKT